MGKYPIFIINILVMMTLIVSVTSTIATQRRNDGQAVFRKRPEVQHVDCARLIGEDREYAKEITRFRPTLIEADLGWSCSSIQKRIFPPRNPNTGFQILYARIVYKDYNFLEGLLATDYASENVYCFSLDMKAPKHFHNRFHNLARCLPNVFVSRKIHDLDSAGHNQNEAHLDCLRLVRNRRWEYAVLMQNHDVIIKTHAQMTEILQIYGGANGIETLRCPDHRCISSLERNLGKLKLCPRSLSGEELTKCQSTEIEWGKGAMQSIISRAAAEFIFDEINILHLAREMNEMDYGVDEQLFNSLQINPEIRLPGGFHHKCRKDINDDLNSTIRIVHYPKYPTLTGLDEFWTTILKFLNLHEIRTCPSGMERHGVCILGVEDLPVLAKSDAVMANKMMPNFDYAVTSCIAELLFNRTRDGSSIRREVYENIDSVRYHREHNDPSFSIDKFAC